DDYDFYDGSELIPPTRPLYNDYYRPASKPFNYPFQRRSNGWRIIPQLSNQLQRSLINHDCGKAKKIELHKMPDSRIVNGFNVPISSAPWVASLVGLRFDGSHAFCGAVIITPRRLLTAAHCINLAKRSGFYKINAVVGTDVKNNFGGGEVFTVEQYKQHEFFVEKTYRNDIAILKLDRDIVYKPNKIAPICLPPRSEQAQGRALVVGFGVTDYDTRSLSEILLGAEVNILPPSRCVKYRKHGFKEEDQICAGWEEGGMDACLGDSGGPLFYWKDNTAYLVGIVSFGIDCGQAGLPGIYTRISTFINWIEENIDF
ncbi:hypothetical protein B4U79_07878, partial [Dinothrombium tinctorium]